MVQGTNLSHDSKAISSPEQESFASLSPVRPRQGVRTYLLLVLAMALVTVTVTGLFLLLIRHRLRTQVMDDLSQDLNRSVVAFHDLQAERLVSLERENALLSELPPLKALMTSGDDLTIQDGAVEFWQLSGNDLFALADASGRVVAAYTNSVTPDLTLRASLQALITSSDKHYLIHGKSLYACSLRPLYFGSDENGTLLGYVISGVSIERTLRQVSQPTGVEATFLSGDHTVASTLSPSLEQNFVGQPLVLAGTLKAPSTVQLGEGRFLAAAEDLSSTSTSPLRLVVFKSLEPAERRIMRIDRVIVSTGLLALLAGTMLMIVLSRLLTRPLEELSRSVRAFGLGDNEYCIPPYGTREVRQLSASFAGMREEIQQGHRALLESERLATIGRMASSVSHDLRHYLAAVYANAEFLASDRLSAGERAEIFADIRAAVHGTTDMIESLLIFSRTGAGVRRSPELMSTLLDRAVSLIRSHPDAEGVKLSVCCAEPAATGALVDGKQIERAIYNLLLNACQAARTGGAEASVDVTLEVLDQYIVINVIDNGPGVPEKIRTNLFEPFVSDGKQKGTGLGLTLANCIAAEHDGEVVLLSSQCGQTVFQMKVTRELRTEDAATVPEAKSHDQVGAHEKVWT